MGTTLTNSDSEWENESFIQQISQLNKSEGTFGNYFGVQEQNLICRILKFDILHFFPEHSAWALYSRPLKIRPIFLEKTEIFIHLTGRSI
jgi:hypothetical protein